MPSTGLPEAALNTSGTVVFSVRTFRLVNNIYFKITEETARLTAFSESKEQQQQQQQQQQQNITNEKEHATSQR